MFRKTTEFLDQVEKGIQLRIPVGDVLVADADGYLDRHCPSQQCHETFKVEIGDWQDLVRDERVFCPVCGHVRPAEEWNTPDQLETIREFAERHIADQLGAAIEVDAAAFNSAQPRHGLVQISMTFRHGGGDVAIPADVSAVMLTKSLCEACGCRSASTGAAFFCPACGHNSARTTFAQVLTRVRNTMLELGRITSELAARTSKDVARNLERDLIEHSLQRLVGGFQRFAEATFAGLPSGHGIKPRPNVFQNLSDSSDIWEKAIGQRYEQMLDAKEFETLHRLFQQRHLLAHQEGIVDQRYIDRSGDRTYEVGQRIVVQTEQILELALGVEHLAQLLAELAHV